uniref:Uncharacterized protein n=1 Tax=Chenopodium quinoa TaxID=63459 RepID=A0A803KT39_CHEQI
MESLEEVEEVFRNCSSSLQSLKLYDCDKLRSFCGGLEHLTALKTLVIWNCPNVRLSEETEDGRPDWMQSLAVLECLRIWDCKRLESINSPL